LQISEKKKKIRADQGDQMRIWKKIAQNVAQTIFCGNKCKALAV
jgi:hypothetical protein